jgi:uncharacterized protein YkwD
LKIKEPLQYLLLLALLFGSSALILRAQIKPVNAVGSSVEATAETPTATPSPTNTADPTSTPEPSSTVEPSATPELTTTPEPSMTPPIELTGTATMIAPGHLINYLPIVADIPPPAPDGCIPYPYVPVYSYSTQQELSTLINAYRLDEGVASLNIIPSLSQAAQRHALDLAENNPQDGHIGSDGSTVGSRASDACYEWLHIGQILGYSEDAEAMLATWMSSAGNRDLILSAEYIDFGVGFVYDPDSAYEYYWVVVFGRPVDAGQFLD